MRTGFFCWLGLTRLLEMRVMRANKGQTRMDSGIKREGMNAMERKTAAMTNEMTKQQIS